MDGEVLSHTRAVGPDRRRRTLVLAAMVAFATLSGSGRCAASEVVAVMGGEGALYREALEALRSDLGETRLTVVDVVRSTPTHRQVERLREYPFEAVVAVGGRAVPVARAIQGRRPLVCCMTLVGATTVAATVGGGGPVLVVPYVVGLERFIAAARERFGLRGARVGLVWSDPALQDTVAAARLAAMSMSASLVALRADGPQGVPGALRAMVGDIDVFWLLPDRSLLEPEALQHVMLFLLENEKPVMACSHALVPRGALFSLAQEPESVGRRVGATLRGWFETRQLSLPPIEPEYMANERLMRTLGLLDTRPGNEPPSYEGMEGAEPQPTATSP